LQAFPIFIEKGVPGINSTTEAIKASIKEMASILLEGFINMATAVKWVEHKTSVD
jgi:hypothetical protein